MSEKLHLRDAKASDYRVLRELLENNHLPSVDIHEPSIGFILGVIDESVVACAALEKLSDTCLLRSVVVSDQHQGQGYANLLCEQLIKNAQDEQYGDIYLLTIDVQGYFLRRGFAVVDREVVPESVRGSRQFSELCPGEAVVMVYRGRLKEITAGYMALRGQAR